MPKVFVPNRSGQDVSSAAKFGDIVIMSEGSQRSHLTKHYRIFSDMMEDSKPDDKVMIVGPASLVGIVSAIMAHKHGKVNYLSFIAGQYNEMSIVLDYHKGDTSGKG